MLVLSGFVGGGGRLGFRVPVYSADDESKWLSKDLKFTGLMGHAAEELMPQRVIKDDAGRSYLSMEGVRLGFAQMCFWLDSDTAKQNCRHARIEETNREPVDFFVADPVSLYREKQSAIGRRNAPGDPPHFVARESSTANCRQSGTAAARSAAAKTQ